MDAGATSLPPDADVGRVALRVEEADPLVEFYEDVIGLEAVDRWGGTAVLGSHDEELFVLGERPDLPSRTADETGLFHAAIRVPTREALGSALARVEEGWRLGGASDHLVSEALYLTDPAGNGLEIYRDRPSDEWPVGDDGRVKMDTLPLDLEELRGLATGADRMVPGTTMGHVHLEVSDLDAAREFYADGLGMGVRQTDGSSAVFLAAGDYHHHVGANVWNGRTVPGDGLGLDWFEVRVPDDAALDGVARRFRALGVETERVAGGLEIRDPDGIEVRVVAE